SGDRDDEFPDARADESFRTEGQAGESENFVEGSFTDAESARSQRKAVGDGAEWNDETELSRDDCRVQDEQSYGGYKDDKTIVEYGEQHAEKQAARMMTIGL